MDNKKLTASVFLDMSKAFDSLNHDLLIKKLRHIHAFNNSGRHLEFLIYDVNRGKISAAVIEL